MVISQWLLIAFILGYSPSGQKVISIHPTEQECVMQLNGKDKNWTAASKACVEVRLLEGEVVWNRAGKDQTAVRDTTSVLTLEKKIDKIMDMMNSNSQSSTKGDEENEH